MGETVLTAIAGILLITLNLQANAGRTFANNCSSYTVYTTFRRGPNWIESVRLCQTQNGSALVSIETKEELNFLKKELTKSNLRYEYFIGLKKNGGQWGWISGNRNVCAVASYQLPWWKHQEQYDGCAKMYFRHGDVVYDDIDCHAERRRGYICEKPVDCQVEKDTRRKRPSTMRHSMVQTVAITKASEVTTSTQQESNRETKETPATALKSTGSPAPRSTLLPVTLNKGNILGWMLAALIEALFLVILTVIIIFGYLQRKRVAKGSQQCTGTNQDHYEMVNPTDAALHLGLPMDVNRSRMGTTEMNHGYAELDRSKIQDHVQSPTYMQLMQLGDTDDGLQDADASVDALECKKMAIYQDLQTKPTYVNITDLT